ncbi:ankyrin [Hypoxylon sp. FL1857]|nr:ankyrin [Hypoxylon sp. FL1857]
METEQSMTLNSRSVSESEWNEWSGFVREEFLIKDRGLHEVAGSLEQRNPHVTVQKLRTKLKQWRFQKNLSAKDWRYVDHSIQKRKAQDKDSVIILSGLRIPRERVKKSTDRHKVVSLRNKWTQPPSPEPPAEDVPLYICTPRATSPNAAPHDEWPKSLPWLQFNETMLPQLMSGVRLLSENESGKTLAQSDFQRTPSRERARPKITFVWAALEKLVRRSMEIVIGSEELAETLLLNKSVDRIAGYLDQAIPASYFGENLHRAIVLSGGTRSEVQREVLKVLLFLISNHLIMDGRGRGSESYMDEARALVDIFRFSGLSEPNILKKMAAIALSNPTMQAVLDLVYEAAVNTETVPLVLKLLAADDRIDRNRPVGRILWRNSYWINAWSALEFSLLRGSLEFASHMTQAHADTNRRGLTGLSTLTLATLSTPDEVAVELIQMLWRNGAIMDSDNGSVALYLAIMKGSTQLINLLHEAGASFSSVYLIEELPIWAFVAGINGKDGAGSFWYHLDHITCLGLAASFSTSSSPLCKDLPDGGDTNDQQTALSLVKYILNLAGPDFDTDGTIKSDAMVFAAMRGYTEVISFLYQNGARVDSQNGLLCPVYAAVNWAQVESCQLLLDFGGSAQAEYRHRKSWHADPPYMLSPLHVAVCYNSCGLIDLLIRYGVDVNLSCSVQYPTRRLGDGFMQQCGRARSKQNSSSGDSPGCISPLSLAITVGSWEAARLLIDSGATFTNDDLFQTACAGQHQLVSRLLAGLDKSAKDFENALHAAIANGHELAAIQLLGSGATIGCETLGLALRHGRHQIAMKLIGMGAELTMSELPWAFRIPDELTLRSLAQSRLSDIAISGRSPDGRSLLENAILSRHIRVMEFALSLDVLAYDSGALCAAVLTSIRSPLIGMDGIFKEMIRRRALSSEQGRYIDENLENTALSIAAYHDRMDIIMELQCPSRREVGLAVLPRQSAWVWPEDSFFPRIERCKVYLDDLRCKNKLDVSILPLNTCSIRLSASEEWDNWHDTQGWLISPLFFAIKNCSEPTIGALLELGCKADVLSISAAIYQNIPLDVTRRLIESCTDINGSKTYGMVLPDPPVRTAAVLGYSDLVKILLDNGADPNAELWQERERMLCELIELDRFDLVDTFLRYGLIIEDTPNIRSHGLTALQTAAKIGHLGIMRRLLERGANPNAHRAVLAGLTAIEAAAHYGRLDAVQLLLDSGFITDGRGRLQYILAVHRAKKAGHSAIMQLLESHREWTADDWEVLRELERFRYHLALTIHVHRDTYTEEEMIELLNCVHDLQKQGFPDLEVVEISPRPNGQERVYPQVKENTLSLDRRKLTVISPDSSTITIDNSVSLVGDCEAQLAAKSNSSQTAASNCPSSKAQSDQLENLSVDEGLPDDFGTSDIISDTRVCFEIAEKKGNVHLGPYNEVRGDKERNRHILKDILGEKEAPVEPMAWPL